MFFIKQLLILTILLGTFGVTLFAQNASVKAKQTSGFSSDEKTKPAVLLELFTSEGCGACPPAERLLETLEKEQPNNNVEIITLALHVDYWDRQGWKDEFSSALFSRRQDIYGEIFKIGSIYTPQMVVDGREYFIGTKAEEIHKSINKSLKTEKAKINILSENEKLKVQISAVPKHENSTVFLAIAEDNLATNVRRGENSGKKLEHTSVVRELRTLGILTAGQNEFNYDQGIQFQPNWKKENIKFVVFVQENQSRKVLGVNRIKAE